MKRFLLFAGDAYYPRGGWGDFVGSFDTEVEAIAEAAKIGGDWYHVVDAEIGQEVATYN